MDCSDIPRWLCQTWNHHLPWWIHHTSITRRGWWLDHITWILQSSAHESTCLQVSSSRVPDGLLLIDQRSSFCNEIGGGLNMPRVNSTLGDRSLTVLQATYLERSTACSLGSVTILRQIQDQDSPLCVTTTALVCLNCSLINVLT